MSRLYVVHVALQWLANSGKLSKFLMVVVVVVVLVAVVVVVLAAAAVAACVILLTMHVDVHDLAIDKAVFSPWSCRLC